MTDRTHLTPTQLQRVKMQQAEEGKPKVPVHFASTTQEILRKYNKYPASLTFHIYETHYRFNNSPESNIIPKSSPMVKNFLKCILKEQIPLEMTELLKDFSIRLYDGCLILQVYDHRNMVTGKNDGESRGDTPEEKVAKPKTYRTLLRPTQISLYYDLLYHTDSALSKFTDNLALQMESEILTLTHRELDLSVPLNPYLCNNYLHPHTEYPKKVWDPQAGDYKLIHRHGQAVQVKRRKLHQDELVLHKSSDYEEIMLLLSTKYKRVDESEENKLIVVGSSSSSAAASAASGGSTGSSTNLSSSATPSAGLKMDVPDKKKDMVPSQTPRTTGQFMRLRLIEEIRKKRKSDKAIQEQKLQEQANALNQSNTRPIEKPLPVRAPEKTPQPPSTTDRSHVRQQVPQFNQNARQVPQSANNGMASAAAAAAMKSSANQTPQQSQQQQIFQNTLTPEEQQHFRHLQSRMTAFAQMGNSGTTPNGQKLNPQQQQQAIQQAKLIQQQLFQKYPVFFRSLKQFQMIQQQRNAGKKK